jgi:hypothetical protein
MWNGVGISEEGALKLNLPGREAEGLQERRKWSRHGDFEVA